MQILSENTKPKIVEKGSSRMEWYQSTVKWYYINLQWNDTFYRTDIFHDFTANNKINSYSVFKVTD